MEGGFWFLTLLDRVVAVMADFRCSASRRERSWLLVIVLRRLLGEGVVSSIESWRGRASGLKGSGRSDEMEVNVDFYRGSPRKY